jgi:hypothetical protein
MWRRFPLMAPEISVFVTSIVSKTRTWGQKKSGATQLGSHWIFSAADITANEVKTPTIEVTINAGFKLPFG